MWLLYRIFLVLYRIIARLLAIFSPKAKKWLAGQTLWQRHLSQFQPNGKPVIWMHCSSLGEFEQGRPVVEAIKQQYPTAYIVLTFFSPSGYEVRKQYAGADFICYLPLDNATTAQDFIQTIQPRLVIWVKYEYWYFYLKTLYSKQIPVLLISALFRNDQVFFAWYGGFYRKMLTFFRHLFVQNEASSELLQTIQPTPLHSVAGDTRFDRVMAIYEQRKSLPTIQTFCAENPIIVAGSTWAEDELALNHYLKIHPHIKAIIAPHEVEPENIKRLYEELNGAITLSDWEKLDETADRTPYQVLIIDNIGMLSSLYQFAHIAYIGGGFGKGIHNILEAAVYGVPVLFGPNYEKFAEAVNLLQAGGAVSVNSAVELEKALDWLFLPENNKKAGTISGEFVKQQVGATAAILQYIQANRLLTI